MKIFSLLIVLMALGCKSPPTDQKYGLIDGSTFRELRAERELIILDVRTPKEYQSGQIDEAINIDITDPTFQSKIKELDKSQEYLVYCAVGGRSARALEEMHKLGFYRVYNLQGGFSKFNSEQ